MKFKPERRFVLLLITSIFGVIFQPAFAGEDPYDKVFFSNSPVSVNYYYSRGSSSLGSSIKLSEGRLPVNESRFFTPGNSLELSYRSAPGGVWSASVLYHPIRGMDNFKTASYLSMWIFNASSTSDGWPEIALPVKGIVNTKYLPLKNYIVNYKPSHWTQVKIPLSDLQAANAPMSSVDEIAFRQYGSDAREHQLFLDQIELLENTNLAFTAIPKLIFARGYEKHIDLHWNAINDPSVKHVKIYRSEDKKKFTAVGIQSPWIDYYSDFVNNRSNHYTYKITFLNKDYQESIPSKLITGTTHAMTDNQLLDMVQESNFRYYWDGAELNSGLSLEDIPGRTTMIASGASGFGIMALIAGTERKFITRQQLVQRFEKITSFLIKAEKFHGAFPHFIDGETGKVNPFFGIGDNGADLVETSFLMQGLLCARQYLNKDNASERMIRARIDKLWREVEWSWFRKPDQRDFLTWHWSPTSQWGINHQLIGWNETMITYLLAICSPTYGVPSSLYYSGWATPSKKGQEYRSGWGESPDGSDYTNGKAYYGIKLPVGVSSGGPLFFVHYSFMGLNPHEFTDRYTNYFDNNRSIARINYRYCVENPKKHPGYGPDAWGLTASDSPVAYSADEPTENKDLGKITPTGALASFPYTPEESMAALKNYYRNWGRFFYGPYGFYDAYSPVDNWRSEIYMGLNQAPITVMIENHRSGLLWNLFMSCPEVKEGLKSF